METSDNYTPSQSDNNNGTLGSDGGLPRKPEQKPFRHFDEPEDIETGNKEYDRHHKEDRVNVIRPVSAEEEAKKGEIKNDLPGNRPDNFMESHAENNAGDSVED